MDRKHVKFEHLNLENTIGKLKKKDINVFLKRYKRIGGLKVKYLADFITNLDEEDVVGIYVDKKNELVPIHSNGWFLAPRVRLGKDKSVETDLYLEGVED